MIRRRHFDRDGVLLGKPNSVNTRDFQSQSQSQSAVSVSILSPVKRRVSRCRCTNETVQPAFHGENRKKKKKKEREKKGKRNVNSGVEFVFNGRMINRKTS